MLAHNLDNPTPNLPGLFAEQPGNVCDLVFLEIIVEMEIGVGVALSLRRHIVGVEVETRSLVCRER